MRDVAFHAVTRERGQDAQRQSAVDSRRTLAATGPRMSW